MKNIHLTTEKNSKLLVHTQDFCEKLSQKITGAQALLECLVRENVQCIFGYPGGAIMPVYDALYDFPHLKHILVRHEQGAAHAAEGYARVSGQAGVCLVTSGPGATNLVTGINDAMADSVPLVCIVGQVSSALLGTDAFQETDIINITTSITKWSYQITSADEISWVLAKAFYIAQNGRPGPVLIDITKDAQMQYCHFVYEKYIKPKENSSIYKKYNKNGFELQILKAANLLNKAKKPLILAGQGVLIAKAEATLKELAEIGDFPVACTLLGLSILDHEHPLYVGMLGMHGNYAPNILTNEADVILAIGMRFDDRVTGNLKTYAKDAKIIHIDIDPAEINKNVNVEVAVIADANVALKELLKNIAKAKHRSWLKKFAQLAKKENKEVTEKELNPQGEIKMAEVIALLSKKTKGEAIMVSDVGQHQMIAARYYQFKQSHAHITSGGLGTMGFAIPAAIGSKFAAFNREVIAIVGDGGFQMCIQELAVIAQENLPVKIIILNNNYLGMVRQWQELFFEKRYSFVNLKNPDFIKIADGYGLKAKRVVNRDDLNYAIDEMLKTKGAYLLEVSVAQKEVVFPMIPAGAGVSEIRLS